MTAYKNIVDKVVTEHGVAELHGASIRERTKQLIAIAHPKFRDELDARAPGVRLPLTAGSAQGVAIQLRVSQFVCAVEVPPEAYWFTSQT